MTLPHERGAVKRPGISEAAFQSQVIHLARLLGWRVHHSRPSVNRSGRWSTALAGEPGLPDLVLARGGLVVFLELKAARGVVSAAQSGWGESISGVPVVVGVPVVRWPVAYLVARPEHFEAVRSLLQRDGRAGGGAGAAE